MQGRNRVFRSIHFRALGELCSAEIIARGRADIEYYINPMCVFNGDRVTFATTYINENYPQYKTHQQKLKRYNRCDERTRRFTTTAFLRTKRTATLH